MAADENLTTSRLLNTLAHDMDTKAAVVTTAAGDFLPVYDISAGKVGKVALSSLTATDLGAIAVPVVVGVDGTGYDVKFFGDTAGKSFLWDESADKLIITGTLTVVDGLTLGATAISASAAEINKLDDDLATNILARGAGVDTAESYAVGIFRNGSIITTRIVVDISTLIGSATDLDIVGETGAASCHWGQITTAKSGTMIGGKVTCLEVPAGGTADIDFYSSDVATGTQDVAMTNAALGTETALVTAGGAWTSGAVKGMTALPTANDYLYICNGTASGGTFTAGKFLIEIYGTA